MNLNTDKIKQVIKNKVLEYTTNGYSLENSNVSIAIFYNGNYEILRNGAYLSNYKYVWAEIAPVFISAADEDDEEVNWWVVVGTDTYLDTDYDNIDCFENAVVEAVFEYYQKEDKE